MNRGWISIPKKKNWKLKMLVINFGDIIVNAYINKGSFIIFT